MYEAWTGCGFVVDADTLIDLRSTSSGGPGGDSLALPNERSQAFNSSCLWDGL